VTTAIRAPPLARRAGIDVRRTLSDQPPNYGKRYQWRIVFAMMKKQVMKLTPTIRVRMSAILSASSLSDEAFSPSAFAQISHTFIDPILLDCS
jgi:hypothetical protein